MSRASKKSGQRDGNLEDLNGMGTGCHKLADDEPQRAFFHPPLRQNEIAEIYPFERPLHRQVSVLSSVPTEFNSVQDRARLVCRYLISDIFFARCQRISILELRVVFLCRSDRLVGRSTPFTYREHIGGKRARFHARNQLIVQGHLLQSRRSTLFRSLDSTDT